MRTRKRKYKNHTKQSSTIRKRKRLSNARLKVKHGIRRHTTKNNILKKRRQRKYTKRKNILGGGMGICSSLGDACH